MERASIVLAFDIAFRGLLLPAASTASLA